MDSIHKTADLEAGIQVGQYTVIRENVRIGTNCCIGHHVVIHHDTVIGDNVRIDDHVTIGKMPMRAVSSVTTREVELDFARVGG